MSSGNEAQSRTAEAMQLSPKQAEFLREGHCRWNMKGGATRSGKTYVDFRWVIPGRIRERIGLEGLTVLLGVTRMTVDRNVLTPMREIYGDLVGRMNADGRVRLFGEECYVLGADKMNQVSKLRGASVKYCYGDEVADWAQPVFELLKSRLDKPYSCFDGTFNPQGPDHWLKRFLDSGADIFYQVYGIDDNPFLPPAFVENLKNEYRGTALYDRYILGQWAAGDGCVFVTKPETERDIRLLSGGIAHLDAAYGGGDDTALTCARRDGDVIYLYGRLWHGPAADHLREISQVTREMRCAPLYMETNADKGFLGREIQRLGDPVRLYHEGLNKTFKIYTYLRKWWGRIRIIRGTDADYVAQIMGYNEQAAHDDAPDSAACACRILDLRG